MSLRIISLNYWSTQLVVDVGPDGSHVKLQIWVQARLLFGHDANVVASLANFKKLLVAKIDLLLSELPLVNHLAFGNTLHWLCSVNRSALAKRNHGRMTASLKNFMFKWGSRCSLASFLSFRGTGRLNLTRKIIFKFVDLFFDLEPGFFRFDNLVH